MRSDNISQRPAQEDLTWSEHLGKAFKRARDRGPREGVRYLRGQICSTSRYHVLRHAMETIPEVAVPSDDPEVLEVSAPYDLIMEEMCHVYPPEFGPCDTEYVMKVLQQYSADGAWCFAARHKARLVGAFWLSRPNHWYAGLNLPYLSNEYVVQNLFVVPSYRGNGASKVLLRYGLGVGRRRDVPSVLSLIPAGRTASVKVHVGVGFHPIGSFAQTRRWFQCREMFVPAEDRQ
jgi:GNAT superfamily N-acetyltransferase